MRGFSTLRKAFGLTVAALFSAGLLSAANAPFRAGYYNSSWNSPPLANINWAAWTQIYHFNAYPRITNGTVTLDTSEIVNPDLLISTAHSHGVRVLLTVFGTTDFINTTDTSAHTSALASLIGNFVAAHNYDGVDIDWESNVPLSNYTSLITALRAQLNTYTPLLGRSSDGKALISGFFGPIGVAAANINNIDIANLSCYDNHTWDTSRWTVWHDAALNDPGDNGWSGGGYSCAGLVASAVQSGIPAAKIGTAIPFYIRDWIGGVDASGEGAQRPGQTMVTAPTMGSLQSLNQLYNTPSLWQSQYMRRDVTAGNVPYLSINQSGSANDHFVSYPDATSITSAWNLVATGYQGVPLGGFTAYTMMHEYIPSGSTVAQQFPLSEALRIAAGANSGSGTAPAGTAPSITSPSPLPGGAPNVAYSQTLSATGTTPISWSITSGSLPSGLSINASTGVISGTPASAGTSNFTVRATNSISTNDKPFAISVVNDPYANWKLDDGSGAVASDSSGNGKTASLAGGPAWLSGGSCAVKGCLSFNGAGQSGAASIDLSDTSAVTVAFWMNWSSYANNDSLAMEFSGNFNNSKTGFMVNPNSSNGGGGQFEAGLLGDVGYNQVLFARPAAGWHHYAFVLNKSASANSEVTPYVDGVAVAYTKPTSSENTNAFGNDTLFLMSRAGSALFGTGALDEVRVYKRALSSAEVGALAQAQTAPSITSPSTLPDGTTGVAYVQTLTATGSNPISWSIASGSLPTGLSLSAQGVISGTPTTAGVYVFTAKATNGVSPDANQSISITIKAPTVPPSITAAAVLPAGIVGAAYSQTLSANGTAPITWSVASGALPAGLALSGSGTIAGTPSVAGTASFTVRASNGTAPDATQNMSLSISAPAAPLAITSTSPLLSGSAGTAYSVTLTATGATPIGWSVVSGTLPGGLSLNATTGVISGTPTGSGSSNFTIRASNSSQSVDKAFTLTIGSLFSNWKFNEGSGSFAADSAGGSKGASLYNSPIWLTSASCALGGCLSFNGRSQYGAASVDLSNTSVVTVAFWLNWGSYSNNDALAMEFGNNFNNSTTGFMIDPNSSAAGGGQFEAGLLGNAGYNQILFARPGAGWHHYAFVFDKTAPAATQVTPYVDGVQVSYTKPTNSANTNSFGSSNLYFMSRGGSSLFGSGGLDDVRIYKRALGATEVQGLANKTIQ